MKQYFGIISKEIFVRRWSLLGFTIGSVAFLLLYVLIYPSFQSEAAKFDELLKAYPKAVLKAFNIDQLSISNAAGYISAEHFSFVWPLLAIFLAIGTAGSSIAGEIEKATLALTLSAPVKRARLFIAKVSSGLLMITGFAVVSILALIPLTMLNDVSIDRLNILKITVLGLAFSLAIYSLAMMFSAIYSEKSKVYFWTGGILISMYVANIVSGLVSSMKNLQYVSFFHYFSGDKALVHGELSLQALGVFVGSTILTLLIAFLVFKKRDISV